MADTIGSSNEDEILPRGRGNPSKKAAAEVLWLLPGPPEEELNDFNLFADFDFFITDIELMTTDESVIVFTMSMGKELMRELDGTR
jgi:hypothetical protein